MLLKRVGRSPDVAAWRAKIRVNVVITRDFMLLRCVVAPLRETFFFLPWRAAWLCYGKLDLQKHHSQAGVLAVIHKCWRPVIPVRDAGIQRPRMANCGSQQMPMYPRTANQGLGKSHESSTCATC